MVNISQNDIKQMDKIYRLNLINSCTGYKSANLIATQSKDDVLNVAVFSSITHLGSNPPLIGFIIRPTKVLRDTYNNIKSTKFFTVNHIHQSMIKDAHHTSAKYPSSVSEFDQTNLEPEFLNSFEIPFVKNAPVQLGCKFLNEYTIKENDTRMIVGEIVELHFDQKIQVSDGTLKLDEAGTVAIQGNDGYALPTLLNRFEFAHPRY